MKYYDARNIFETNINSYCANDTISYYYLNLNLFERYLLTIFDGLDFDISKFKKEHFVGYISYLRQTGVKNTSVRTYGRAIKAFLRFLWQEGYITENVTRNVKFPRADNAPIMPLTNLRVKRLLSAIEANPLSARNKAIFLLMLDCGLRIGEVVRLNVDDIDYDEGFIRIVDSKCNKSRVVPMPVKVRRCISAYLQDIKVDRYPCPLFRDKGGIERITKNCIKVFISKLKKCDSDIHCHLLRHTFATSFMMGGGQLEFLRLLLGHEGYEVTRQYLHLSTQMSILNYDIYKLDGCMFNAYISYNVRNTWY